MRRNQQTCDPGGVKEGSRGLRIRRACESQPATPGVSRHLKPATSIIFCKRMRQNMIEFAKCRPNNSTCFPTKLTFGCEHGKLKRKHRMIALALALLTSANTENSSLRDAVRMLSSFEHRRYVVAHRQSFAIGELRGSSNEGGAVLIAGRKGLLTIEDGHFTFRAMHWPDEDMMFLRRNSDGNAFVIGDGETEAALYENGKWSTYTGIASAFFLKDGRPAYVPAFNDALKQTSGPKQSLVRTGLGSLDIDGWSFRLLDDRHDKTKISAMKSGRHFAFTIPSREELEWPGLYYSPTARGFVIYQVSGRTPDFIDYVTVDARRGRVNKTSSHPSFCLSADSASEDGVLVSGGEPPNAITEGETWLVGAKGSRAMRWKADWTPIWARAMGVVFMRTTKSGVDIALARPAVNSRRATANQK